jgi:hypothetical protein
MMNQVGIIFLDGDEVIVRIYATDSHNKKQLFRYQCYDLATGIPGKAATATEIVEIIAGVFFTRYASEIVDWKICARNIHEAVIHDVTTATGLKTEILTLQREQELLCKGMLMEFD